MSDRSPAPFSRNIELKARDPDPARSLQTSLALGAGDRGFLHQTDTYFDVAKGRLKLREQEQGSELIYYERADESEARESRYRIVPVLEAQDLKDALALALGVLVVVEKSRRLLLWRNVRIHIDKVKGLGSFIELEAVAQPSSDLEGEHHNVKELCEALGITAQDILPTGYSDQLRATSTSSL